MSTSVNTFFASTSFADCLLKSLERINALCGFLVTVTTMCGLAVWLNIAARVGLHRNWRCRDLAAYRHAISGFAYEQA